MLAREVQVICMSGPFMSQFDFHFFVDSHFLLYLDNKCVVRAILITDNIIKAARNYQCSTKEKQFGMGFSGRKLAKALELCSLLSFR